MLEKYNRYKLLKIFLDNPTEDFRLRELSRLSKISPPSVMIYLKEFEEEKLIERFTKRRIPFYKADRDNEKFKHYKRLSILYGSFAKGESIETSDVDIFIVGKYKEVDVNRYENKLGYQIHLMGDELKNTSKEFR